MILTLQEQEAKLRNTEKPSSSMLNTWYDLLLKNNQIFIEVDTREQNPIVYKEIGIQTRKTTLQTGDYAVMVKNIQIPILWERKGGKNKVDDIYSTLYFGRDRFYNELERAITDNRIYSFILMCEGSMHDFLKYVPFRDECKYCKHYTPNKTPEGKKDVIGICNNTEIKITKELDTCFVFEDILTKEERQERILNSKKATINALRIKPKVQVIFCDSRRDMIEQFKDMIRQWVLHNWKMIIGVAEVVEEEDLVETSIDCEQECELGFC